MARGHIGWTGRGKVGRLALSLPSLIVRVEFFILLQVGRYYGTSTKRRSKRWRHCKVGKVGGQARFQRTSWYVALPYLDG